MSTEHEYKFDFIVAAKRIVAIDLKMVIMNTPLFELEDKLTVAIDRAIELMESSIRRQIKERKHILRKRGINEKTGG